MWRSALAFLAAYLLVLQAALAGGAVERMQAAHELAGQVICLNGASDAEPDHAAPFDCCGLGCLVGAQSLPSPSAPDQNLVYPAARAFDAADLAEPSAAPRPASRGSSPRAPPAVV